MRIYIRAKWLKPLANIDFDKCGRTEAAQLDSDAMSSTPTQAEQQGGRKKDENQIEALEFKRRGISHQAILLF